ncbi:MAG: protease [Bdellovibrionota bacterium]
MTKSAFALAFVSFLASASVAVAQSPFSDLDQVASALKLDSFRTAKAARTVRIAILDNGFRGYQAEVGKSLPASTKFHAGPVAVDPQGEESHGLFMAQIVAGLLGKNPQLPYELHLYSAFGYSNLEQAVQAIANEKFDVVLYSQVWEYGGNGDGRGFINALVSRATGSTVWVNASGNFGDATFKTAITAMEDAWAKLPGPNNAVRVRCQTNSRGKCQLRALLTWNDFKDDVAQGTDKDLDLVLTDDTLKIVRTSGLQQVKSMPTPPTPGTSLYPREIIQAELTPGVYFLRVKVRSSNFTSTDSLKLHATGDFIQQVDANSKTESLLPPADNAAVITVGASDSAKSAVSTSMGKPELVTRSLLTLTSGDAYKGSSNAAAVAAALAAMVKSVKPDLDRAQVLTLLKGDVGGFVTGQGLPIEVLEFQPTGAGCFLTAALPTIPRSAEPLFRGGAVGVRTSMGLKILTAIDPFTLTGMTRVNANDMLVATNSGIAVMLRSSQRMLPPGTYEIAQIPRGQTFCAFNGTPQTGSSSSNQLRLPPLTALGQ